MKPINQTPCSECTQKEKCIFRILTNDQKQKLNLSKLLRQEKKDAIIFEENTPADTIYLIINGLVKVSKQVHAEHQYILDMKSVGEVMGFNAAKGEATYDTDARTMSDTVLCSIPGKLVADLMKVNNAIYEYLLKIQQSEMKAIANRSIDLQYGTAQLRLAKALLLLNQHTADGKHYLNVKRDELANMAAVTRETVSRQLSVWNKGKIIKLDIHHIMLLQPMALKIIAETATTYKSGHYM